MNETIAPATATRDRFGVWLIRVACCPICGKSHVHGGGDGAIPAYGHRAAHCGKAYGTGYVLAPAAEEEKKHV